MDTLNINFESSKFDQLKCFLQENVNILALIESKLSSSFSTNQFLMEGYFRPFRFDRNRRVGSAFIDQWRYIMQETKTA